MDSRTVSGGLGLRVARAAVFAALSVALSAGGHLLVTGGELPVDVLLLAFAASTGVGLLLAAAERGYAAIAAVLVPLQLALNALFNSGQQACPPGQQPSGGGDSWSRMLVCGGGSVRPTFLGVPQDAAPHALGNLAGGQILVLLVVHVLAALVAAAWLRRGEAALFAALRGIAAVRWTGWTALTAWLGPLVLTLVETALLPPPLPDATGSGPQDVLRRSVLRRGPPRCAPAC